MAVKTYYLGSGQDGNFGALFDGAAQTAASRSDGWTSAKIASTNASDFDAATKQTSGTFAAASGKPSALITSATANAFKTPAALNGTFANTSWAFTFAVRATVASSQVGRMRMRVYRSVNADGSAATEITGATQVGTTSAALSTSADVTTVVTWSPGAAISLNNEYLFFTLAWEITTAGGSNSADVVLRTGSTGPAGTRLVTPDFAVAQNLAIGKRAAATTVRGITPLGTIFAAVGYVPALASVPTQLANNAGYLNFGYPGVQRVFMGITTKGPVVTEIRLWLNKIGNPTATSLKIEFGSWSATLDASLITTTMQEFVWSNLGIPTPDGGYNLWVTPMPYPDSLLDSSNCFNMGLGQPIMDGNHVAYDTGSIGQPFWNYSMALTIKWSRVRGVTFIAPIYTTLIDDFNRADGPIYAGAGASIWRNNHTGGTALTQVAVIGNQVGTTAGYYVATTKSVTPGSISDLVVDCVNPGGGSVNFYCGMTDTDLSTFGGFTVGYDPGSTAWWASLINIGSMGSISGVAPQAGETYWLAQRGTTYSLYKAAAGGGAFVLVGTWSGGSPYVGGLGIAFVDTTQRWDNLRGGPLVVAAQTFAIGRVASATSVKGITLAPWPVTVVVGKKASVTSVKGITLTGTGAAPLTIGKRASATSVKGVTVSGSGTVTVAIGKVGGSGSTLLDNYNRADAASLGANYGRTTFIPADPIISGNQAGYPGGESAAVYTATSFGADQEISMKFMVGDTFGAHVYFFLSVDNGLDDCYLIDWIFDSPGLIRVQLFRRNAASWTTLSGVSGTYAWATGDVFTVSKVGADLIPKINGTALFTQTDPAPLAHSGYVGFGGRGSTLVKLDDLTVGGGAGGTTVRGVTPVVAGAAPISIGKRTPTTAVRGITLAPGIVVLSIGTKASVTAVRGVTLAGATSLIAVGRKVAATTVRGVTLVVAGTAPITIGKCISATSVRGVTLVPGPVTVLIGKRAVATTVRGVTVVGTGIATPLLIGRRASTTMVNGVTLASGVGFIPVGKRLTATTAQGITVLPIGVVPITVGTKASVTTVRGITLVPTSVTTTIGRIISGTVVYGAVIIAAPVGLPIGRRASTSTVRGVTLVVSGVAPITIGKRAAATTVRGMTFIAGGIAPLSIGKVYATVTVRGVTPVPGAVIVSIGRHASTTTVRGVTLLSIVYSTIYTTTGKVRYPTRGRVFALGTQDNQNRPTRGRVYAR